MFINLKILVVDSDFNTRSGLKEALRQLGQPEVKMKGDVRELFKLPRAVNFDLVFINANPGFGLKGPDLIRFLTRANLVTPWCKFVITSEDPDFQLTAPIFRHLQTQILHLPIQFPPLKSLINTSTASVKALKPLLTKLHKISPKELIQAVSKIDLKFNDPVVNDELLSLKLKLLIQGKRPDLALKVASTLNSEACRLRENLWISYTTGQQEDFDQCLAEAWQSGRFKTGSVYFRCNYLLVENKFQQALEHFENLPSEELQQNEIEVLALLKQKVFGVKTGFDFIDNEIKKADKRSMTYHGLVLTKLKMCFIALVTDDFEYYDQMELYLELENLIGHQTWINESYKYHAYQAFAVMGISLIEGDKKANVQFEHLAQNLTNLDSSQLNALLFAANVLERKEESLRIHEQLDKLIARVEVSPELLSFRINHAIIMENTMEPEHYRHRLEHLAHNHWQAGRHYRALAKFRQLQINFDTTTEFQRQYKKLIRESGLQSYWGFSADD